jgi:HPt (histidine-containing phosphotransfer) domain-containing protein
MIVYENGKIIAISKNLLNLFNIPLEKISEVINKIQLEMAVLNQNSIELFNILFKVKKEDLLTLKNLDIYVLEKIEGTKKIPEDELLNLSIEEKSISNIQQPEQPLFNENDLLTIPVEEEHQISEIPQIIEEEEEENKPIELNFNDNISECEKIFEKKDNINDIIKKELNLASEELGIDKHMANELFKDLLNQIKEKKEELYKAIKEKNYEEIHKIAHFLKGACLNLRLSNLAFIFKTIDEESKNKTEIDKIKNLTDKLYDFINPLYNNQQQEIKKENVKKIENKNIKIDPKIKNLVINTIRYYLETQDEKKFQKDKKYIEKLLNTKIDSINDLENIVKGN